MGCFTSSTTAVVTLLLSVAVLLGHAAPAPDSVLKDSLLAKPSLEYHFVGSGFHQRLHIAVTLRHLQPLVQPVNKNYSLRVTINLPKAYFFDIPEVLQMHDWEPMPSLERNNIELPTLESVTSQHVFDIEAPIFRIPYDHNRVDITIGLNAQILSYPDTLKLAVSLPVHTRYEEVDTLRPFSWSDFIGPIDAYKQRCIEPSEVRAELRIRGANPLSKMSFQTVSPRACVNFPQGILSQLQAVYWLTMGLLSAGAGMIFLIMW